MNRNRNYDQSRNWDEQNQYPQNRNSDQNRNSGQNRNNDPQRRQEDMWHPNRIDYRNDERERFRGAYRLDNSPENRDTYRNLNQENYGRDYSYGHAGNSRNGADRGRHQSDYGTGATYGASRNAGSMGSYGGAQGFGSASNGYNNERWASGHHEPAPRPRHQVYGAYRDSNSFAPGERESYDGSSRYGSQGADNTRGWRRTEESEQRQTGRYNRFTPAEDDSRYEIYDTSESQYNRGNYNNSTQGSITDDLNLRSHQEFSPYDNYGSRQRARNRQGSGYDQDMYSGTSDLDYGNTATPFESEAYPRNRYYDPISGNAWNPGSER
ncbi:hypothetical protein I5M27_13675 [Adhaeribacter sp. BT258]|uniref:Uncharacterized protein n=1 Tax=Adhaeribacter terrigena TaxID=2793070 RepID=A0ABS1C3V3_9BACT|nr:hypothetical protein [Adhaeribacter terrigena]MBK0404039.1 hypothetical protein [Adhaeribacter terrigena]